jgi:hypothetical protein
MEEKIRQRYAVINLLALDLVTSSWDEEVNQDPKSFTKSNKRVGFQRHSLDLNNLRLPVMELSCFPIENVINADEWITMKKRSRRRCSPSSSLASMSRSAGSNSNSNIKFLSRPRFVNARPKVSPNSTTRGNHGNLGRKFSASAMTTSKTTANVG